MPREGMGGAPQWDAVGASPHPHSLPPRSARGACADRGEAAYGTQIRRTSPAGRGTPEVIARAHRPPADRDPPISRRALLGLAAGAGAAAALGGCARPLGNLTAPTVVVRSDYLMHLKPRL